MRGIASGAVLILLAAAVFIGISSVFTVDQTQQALVLRFGEAIKVVREPGINFKAPFVDSVVRVDKRILALDLPAEEVIASDQKRIRVDAFARYRIENPLRFYQTLGSVERANSQLATFVNSGLRRVLGESTFQQVVRDQREQLMNRIRDQVNTQATGLGIQVVDVRIRRADLPEQNSQAVYQRMQTERQREAAEIRAEGAEAAQRIRSRADRDVVVVLAEANREAERTRGEGDGQRNAIFAQAYGQDRDFFAFYRSMQAYEAGLSSNDTRFVLSPDSEFFRYFRLPTGGAGAAGPAGTSTTPAPGAASPVQ
ncbi:protease modulator HflC [Terrihabitans sp. B22-R8]|uniref:protease modulator HflC n=1 Tax=Terrihabitans sp. B22-R8 TaxID=3425128 RepID=UPI00403C4AC1